MGVAHRYGIVIPVETNQRQLVDSGRYLPGGFKRGRQCQESRLVFSEQFPLGSLLTAEPSLEVFPAALFQRAIEFLEAVHFRDRNKIVETGKLDDPFHDSFFVGTAYPAKSGIEQIMALQLEKSVRQLPTAGAGDPDDTGAGIVVANPGRNPFEKSKPSNMSVLEGFRTHAGIGDNEHRIGIGQCHSKEGDLDQLPRHFHQGKTKVHLGFPRLVQQGNEDFSARLVEVPNRLFNLGVASTVTLLLQPLEDPFRRMPLFAGQFPIHLEDSGNAFQIRTDLDLGAVRRSKLRWGGMH